MDKKIVVILMLCFTSIYCLAQESNAERLFGLEDVRKTVEQNRLVIVETYNQRIASEKIKQHKAERLPQLELTGDSYMTQTNPLNKVSNNHSFLYHFNIGSEFDVYTGGVHRYAIDLVKQQKKMSDEKCAIVKQEILLKSYVLLYDIYRNRKYQEFIQSSIHLREMEYKRIEQLYSNGLVLKSDLLRSKLYITDLQKDEVSIKNSIAILSEQLATLLNLKETQLIIPSLKDDLSYAITDNFTDLFSYALQHSPSLQYQHTTQRIEEVNLKSLYANLRPQIKLYGKYGIGTALPTFDYTHQLGGEFGAKISFSISSFYKQKPNIRAQRQRIQQQQVLLAQNEEELHHTLFELYTRYHESLINIERMKEKIALSKESARILHNSYYNQQALLIDVLESETQTMKASFEWVEAVVDSQKYYWALKQLSGHLNK